MTTRDELNSADDLHRWLNKAVILGIDDAIDGYPMRSNAAVAAAVKRQTPPEWQKFDTHKTYRQKLRQAYGAGYDAYAFAKANGDVGGRG